MKPLEIWKFAKLQKGFCNADCTMYYRIMVKDKWWHRWKPYFKTCFYEDALEIWNKQYTSIN